MDTLQQAVIDLNDKAKLTQGNIARALGCTQATISHIKNNGSTRPSARMEEGLRKLTKKYKRLIDAAEKPASCTGENQ